MTTFYKGTFLIALALIAFSFISYVSRNAYAGMVCTCRYYEYYPCPGNAGCRDTYRCGPGTCKRCGSTECHDDSPPPCEPIQIKCVTTCGVTASCRSNGCGGQVCCPGTAPCGPACVDSDGGSIPNVYGSVTISAPALPQVLTDSCMTLSVTTSGGSTSSRWVNGITGTHVGEKTCANTTTGAYSDSVIACPNQCSNGACNVGTPTPIPPACPKRPQGDANCDQVINNADYESVFKPKMNGQAYPCPNCTADFNSDGKVDLVDYEIWRNTLTISSTTAPN